MYKEPKWVDQNGKVLDPQPTVDEIKSWGGEPRISDYENTINLERQKYANLVAACHEFIYAGRSDHLVVRLNDAEQEAYENLKRLVGSRGPELPKVTYANMLNEHLASALLEKLPEDLHTNTKVLVLRFAEALAKKLYKAQVDYGYDDSWLKADWRDKCTKDLHEHLRKGDPRDVAAYCAFMWHHKWPTSLPVTETPFTQDELYTLLTELTLRIETCGASPELTNASCLASDLAGAIGNKWNPPRDYCVKKMQGLLMALEKPNVSTN